MSNAAGSQRKKRSDGPAPPLIGDGAVATLLNKDKVRPDLLIEMLLPVLWLSRVEAFGQNSSVEGAMVLHHAYEQLGIASHVYTVTLTVRDPESDEWIEYGRPDPLWDEGVLDGHCLLWLEQSGRVVDATVEQFASPVKASGGFVIGRPAGAVPPAEVAATGGLEPGSYVGVASVDGDRVYQLTGPAHRDLVTSSLSQEDNERYRRAGVNLASRAVTLFRVGSIAEKVRRAPYPRLHALLDAVGEAEFVVESSGDFFFTVCGAGGTQSLRLDEIPIGKIDMSASHLQGASPSHDVQELGQVEKILRDTATAARTLQVATAATGGGDLPVVLFEPLGGVGMRRNEGGPAFEAQTESIIASGFGRFLPGNAVVPRLPTWSIRHTPGGLELWDAGGLWARAELSVGEDWLDAADARRVVRVIYGVFVGVRIPRGHATYTEADREAELLRFRRSGIVAAAEIPWGGRLKMPRRRWWSWNRKSTVGRAERGTS